MKDAITPVHRNNWEERGIVINSKMQRTNVDVVDEVFPCRHLTTRLHLIPYAMKYSKLEKVE